MEEQIARLPLYQQVREDLLSRITRGKFAPGGRLPSEHELCRHYKVSKITIRRAISDLVQAQVLYTVQGKGTFVSDRDRNGASQGLIRFVAYSLGASNIIRDLILKKFDELNSGRRIDTVTLAQNQGMRELVKGGLADLFVLREDELPGLMADGALLDLTEFVERDLDLNDYYREPFPFCCAGSRLHAFPMTFSPVVMVYNRAHFEEAGLAYPDDWDWAAFLDYARRLTVGGNGNGHGGGRYGFFLGGGINRWTTFLLQNNGGVFDANGNFILDSARSLEALWFCRDLMLKHRVAPIGVSVAQTRPFVTGTTSMFLESYYHIPYINKELEWDMGRLPQGRTRATLYVGSHLGIHRECRYPELAWELLKQFISFPAQRMFLEQRIGGPVLRSVVEEEGASRWLPKHRDLFWAEMEAARPIYWGNDSTRMKNLVSDSMEMVWSGIETPEEACAEIRHRVGMAEGYIRF